MTIENITHILKSNLHQNGTCQEVFRATVYAHLVDEGDLCFIQSEQEAIQAVKKGASALVFSDIDFISKVPESITLIKVDDLKKAAFMLVGAVVGEEDASFELIKPKEMTFLRMILQNKKNIHYLPNDWKKAFEIILESKKRLFVGCDEEMLKAIRPKLSYFKDKAPGQIVSADSLFRTTFKIHKYIYQYQKITPLHIDILRLVVGLCDKYELPYSLDKMQYTKHFYPIFIEGEPSVQEVMKNDKVIILSDDLEDILEAKEYASGVGTWMAKTMIMVPPKTKVDGVKYPTYYRNDEEVLELINSLQYNYLFIFTDSENILYKIKEFFNC